MVIIRYSQGNLIIITIIIKEFIINLKFNYKFKVIIKDKVIISGLINWNHIKFLKDNWGLNYFNR